MFDRSSSGFRKIENEIFKFFKDTNYGHIDIDNYTKYNIRIPFAILGVSNIRRKDTHRSQKTYVRSHTGTAFNYGNIAQKLTIAEFSESFQTSRGVTTAWQTDSSNAIGIGVKAEGGIDLEVFAAKLELSASYTYTWGDSESTSNEDITTNTTSHTYKSQDVNVSPFSKVDLTTDFYSFTDTTHYLIDLRIGNWIEFSWLLAASKSSMPEFQYDHGDGKPHIFINSQHKEGSFDFNILNCGLRDKLNSIKFERDEVKISCTNRCILKDVPIIIKNTGIDTQGYFGPQVPIKR